MRLIAVLVPVPRRERWRAEWDGELWYGVAGKSEAGRWRWAAGLATGVLRDALHLRRLATNNNRRLRRSGERMMSSLLSDVRFGLRALRKAPGFTAVVTITLALGIGGTATIFSVVNALLLRPLPYPDADRLVILWQGRQGASVDKDWFSPGQFADIQTQTEAFESVALAEGSSSIMTGRGRPAQVGWVQAQSALLQMLGARAVIGRVFDEGDDRPGASAVALLTYALWQRAYGGDVEVVGQDVTLDGTDFEIVGVLAPNFLLNNEVLPTWGGIGRVDVVQSAPLSEELLRNRENEGYNVIGKLRPGVTVTQAQAELDLVAAGIQELHESDPNSGFFIRAVPLIEEVVGRVRRPLIVLLAAVAGVLLIACVNVANLLLARAESRRREVGVRSALGANWGRLVRQLLTESALLAAMGGMLGIGLAAVGLAAVQRLGAASLPRLSEIGIDGRVLGFALVITAATCLVFGWVPAWRAARVDPADTMKSGGRGTVQGGALWSRFNLSSALVVTEIGMSLVLLVGGALLTRSFAELQRVDPGFAADGQLTFRVRLSGPRYDGRASRLAFHDRLAEGLSALPGVEAVGGASVIPMTGGVSWGPIDLEVPPPQGADHEIVTEYRIATPGYFEAMGIPLIRGRLFDEGDRLDEPSVVIIDERFAETYFPGRDPVGMRLSSWWTGWATIVGVIGTVKHEALDHDSRVTTYYPYGQVPGRGIYMTVRAAGDLHALATPVKRVVRELDDDLAVLDVRSMESRVSASLAERRFAMTLLQTLSLIALVLACVGIYGLISYRVNQGVHELGLRLALGASSRRILLLVLRYGLALAVAGVAIGIAVAVMLTGFLRSMLFVVDALDIGTFGVVATGLIVTTVIACYVPARRATKVDPLGALKSE